MNKIVDLRHRKHARKITITICGNSIFSGIYNEKGVFTTISHFFSRFINRIVIS